MNKATYHGDFDYFYFSTNSMMTVLFISLSASLIIINILTVYLTLLGDFAII